MIRIIYETFLKTIKHITIILIISTCSTSFANDRLALVIGNGNYKSIPLKNPYNDAQDIASVLRDKLNFKVYEYHDLGRVGMLDAVNSFQEKLERANNPIAFFYYAGHGIQSKNNNYLIPIDEHIKKKHQIKAYGINVNTVLEAMRTNNIHLGVALLDACRDNPFENSSRSFGKSRGLARAKEVSGLIIGYATRPGSIAKDGTGRNSPYASILKQVLPLKNYSIQDMLNEVGLRVKRTYGQEPWISSSPVPRVVLNSEKAVNSEVNSIPTTPNSNNVKNTNQWGHQHPAIQNCTESIRHTHKYSKKNHSHRYKCNNTTKEPMNPLTGEITKSKQSKTAVDIYSLQRKLTEAGFYSGPIDGVVGPGTRSALKRFMNR